jgi:hypothetical protein
MVGAHAFGDKRVTLVALEEQPRPPSGEFVGTRTVVSMELDGPTTQSVVNEARGIYDGLRLHVGLLPGTGHEPVAMSPMNRLLMFDPKSRGFFRIAERLYDEGNYLYTVVAAQTAFELYMEGVFEYVLHLHTTVEIGAAIRDLIRSYNLNDRQARNVWEALTGHNLTEDEKTWNAYKAHLKRRNELVHRGERVAKDEAKASLNAVNELAVGVAAIVIRLMPHFREEGAE